MKIDTCDPTCWIIEQQENRVVYETIDGEKWEIIGRCNQCGECEIGSNNPYIQWTGVPVGQPYACYDTRGESRPDSPVRPEISDDNPNCTLSGSYL